MNIPEQILDPVPIWLLFVGYAVISLIIFQAGYLLGRWWQERTPDEHEGLTGMLVGSLLATLAFLLAVTMGMASDRFDARRALVLNEANTIGTTYLRAGYLPEPQSSDIQNLLREYVPLRVVVADNAQLVANAARSVEIHEEIWATTEELARTTPDSVVLGLFIETLNDMIDLHTERVVVGVYARVPDTVLYLLVIGAWLAVAMVGYNAGLTRHRSLLSAVILIVALGAILTLVVDLDRPRDGFVRVSQQALVDLQEQLGPPSP